MSGRGGFGEGRDPGAQALQVRVVEPPPTVAVKVSRKKPDEMGVLVEDLIKLLDGVSNGLRRGRYPERTEGRQVAAVLRAVADNLDA